MSKKDGFVTGALLESKSDGSRCFLEHSYAQAFGGRNYSSLAVIWLNKKGNPEYSSAWHNKSNFKVIDSDLESNLQKIIKFNKKSGGAPICMKASLAQKLGYTSIHTYASARSNRKSGEIKL